MIARTVGKRLKGSNDQKIGPEKRLKKRRK